MNTEVFAHLSCTLSPVHTNMNISIRRHLPNPCWITAEEPNS